MWGGLKRQPARPLRAPETSQMDRRLVSGGGACSVKGRACRFIWIKANNECSTSGATCFSLVLVGVREKRKPS